MASNADDSRSGQRPAASGQGKPRVGRTISEPGHPSPITPSSAGRRPLAVGRLALESRVALVVLLGGLPAVVIALIWLWTGEHGIEVRWTLTVLVTVSWLAAAAVARERVDSPAADVVEPVVGASRRRLLRSWRRCERGRRPRHRHGRDQRARQHASVTAARRDGSDGVTANGDDRDRLGDLRVRWQREASTRESRRRATPGAARSSGC